MEAGRVVGPFDLHKNSEMLHVRGVSTKFSFRKIASLDLVALAPSWWGRVVDFGPTSWCGESTQPVRVVHFAPSVGVAVLGNGCGGSDRSLCKLEIVASRRAGCLFC